MVEILKYILITRVKKDRPDKERKERKEKKRKKAAVKWVANFSDIESNIPSKSGNHDKEQEWMGANQMTEKNGDVWTVDMGEYVNREETEIDEGADITLYRRHKIAHVFNWWMAVLNLCHAEKNGHVPMVDNLDGKRMMI